MVFFRAQSSWRFRLTSSNTRSYLPRNNLEVTKGYRRIVHDRLHACKLIESSFWNLSEFGPLTRKNCFSLVASSKAKKTGVSCFRKKTLKPMIFQLKKHLPPCCINKESDDYGMKPVQDAGKSCFAAPTPAKQQCSEGQHRFHSASSQFWVSLFTTRWASGSLVPASELWKIRQLQGILRFNNSNRKVQQLLEASAAKSLATSSLFL